MAGSRLSRKLGPEVGLSNRPFTLFRFSHKRPIQRKGAKGGIVIPPAGTTMETPLSYPQKSCVIHKERKNPPDPLQKKEISYD